MPETAGDREMDLKSPSSKENTQRPTYFSVFETPRVQRDGSIREHCLDLSLVGDEGTNTFSSPVSLVPPPPPCLCPPVLPAVGGGLRGHTAVT